MKKKEAFQWALLIISLFIFFEIALRVQQYYGPLYDLRFNDITSEGLSDVVNHKPLRKQNHKLSNVKMYEEYNGYEYTNRYDENGVRESSLMPKHVRDKYGNRVMNILFMGDSFIEGYDDKNTIPWHVLEYFKGMDAELNVYNAGYSSYSTAIFIPQAKYLVPKISPDFVVVDIDETDLGDDYIRYRKLIRRDDRGKIIGVKFSQGLYEKINGILKIKEQPFYLVRLAMSVYHEKIYMPSVVKKLNDDRRYPLSISQDKSPNVREKYKKEIEFFHQNVSELAETLIRLMGDRRRILFLYHPHRQHLQPDSDGQNWNDFVSSTVESVAKTYDIAFYNASDDLRIIFKGRPQDYYWSGGNLHFNFTGLKIYSELVAKRLLLLISNMGKPSS
jgi:lysophospholipase L1-like esterase